VGPNQNDDVLPDPATTKSKGFTLKGALAFVEYSFGPKGVADLLEAVDEETRQVLETNVLSSSWYPFRVQVNLYESVDRVFGKGDLALCREIGRYTAARESSTMHKLILKFSNLEIWLRSAALMWSMYYSCGAIRPEGFSADSGTIRVSGFNPISKAFCYDLAGWLEKTAEMSGKKTPAVIHTECVLDGCPECVYSATWKP